MTAFEVYNLFLCVFVFIGFTAVFGVMLTMVVKFSLKTIKFGLEDEKLKTEYRKMQKSKHGKVVDMIVSVILCVVVFLVFGFSVVVGLMPDKVSGNIPTVRVVNSGSMASKNEGNDYLYENNLNDQIQTFDLILTYKLPDEKDLKLYDIVVYEVDGILIMHRIVGIEEPNSDHSGERWFLLQGDAVASPDRFPVKYKQMKAIYNGERVPFVGSFVTFMQSPAGWLCIILVIVAVVLTPILEKKILGTAKKRLIHIGFVNEVGEIIETEETVATLSEELIEKVNSNSAFEHLKGRKDERTFEEKLLVLPEAKSRYDDINAMLCSIVGARVINAKKQKTYKCKNVSLARIGVRGKTLNVYLGLKPEELKDTKYKFIDLSEVEKYKNYPVRVKLTSDRQLRWSKELINKMVEKNNLEYAPIEEIVEEINKKQTFEHLKGKKDQRTLEEKLRFLPTAKERYDEINAVLCSIVGVRIITAKKSKTFKVKNTPIAKLTIRGKTLNVYLSINPNVLAGSKYKFVDHSESVKYKNYPTRMKITSNRQLRWAKELIKRIINENQLMVGGEDEK